MAHAAFLRRGGVIVSVVALFLLASPSETIAEHDGDGGDECGEGSTPGLVITGVNDGNQIIESEHDRPPVRFTLTAQTNKTGEPQANVVFDNGETRVHQYEVHRIFLRDESHEDLESEDICEDDGQCDDDHEEGIGAGLRGLATLDTGEQVRFQIDVQDRGTDPFVDRVRVRWRPLQGEHETKILASDGACEGGWTYTSGWVNVRRVDIRQR